MISPHKYLVTGKLLKVAKLLQWNSYLIGHEVELLNKFQ